MELVLLKSSLCLLAFIAFYKVFLERTSNHHFKRIYLLGVILVSIVIPFITFVEYIEPQTVINNFTEITNLSELQNEVTQEPQNYVSMVLWSIYGLGVLLFLARFIYNLSGVLIKIKRNPKQKASSFISVLLKDLVIPHTFFSYIFLNKIAFENNEIPNEVLLHEQTHAKQKHSLDILFIEFLQVIFWFHPLVYILKKDIKLNHEFLADQAVLNQGIESINYQKTLLTFSSNKQELTLEHAINYSSIKKRFTVMKTQTSKKTLWLRSLLILPLLAILIFSFSTKKQIEKETQSQVEIIRETPKQTLNATPEEIAEYNKLASYYNKELLKNGSIQIKLKDIKRIEHIYSLMSMTQKQKTEPYPNFPPIPPSPIVKKGEVSNIPPPPPAPKVKKGKVSNIPPPPPPIPGNATKEQRAKYEKVHEEYNEKYSVKNGEVYENMIPPPPPPPRSPLDHVIHMAKENATFYFDGKKITSDQAIKLLKKNDEINISTKTNNGLSTVNLSTKPIEIKD